MKKLCMFCMRSHKKMPKLCDAKSRIIRGYLKEGVELWQVMAGIHSGLIDLEGTALRVVRDEGKKQKRKSA